MNQRRAGLLIVQTLLGAALLAVWFRAVDLAAVGTILAQTRWPFVLLAAALGLLSGALRVFRFQILLRPIARVPYLELYQIGIAAALVNFLIPLRTGEATKSLLLRLRHRMPVAVTLPTVALDRSFDLFAVLVVGAAGALLGVPLDGRLSLVILVGGLLLLGFGGFVVLAIRWRSRLLAILAHFLPNRLGESIRAGIIATGEKFLSGFSTAGQGREAFTHMFLLSFTTVAVDAFSLYLLFLSLGPPTSVTVIVTGFALLSLTYLVPGAPGYLGSVEAFGSFIFTGLGIGTELAATVVVLNHALVSLMVVVLGSIVFWSLGLRPNTIVLSILRSEQRHRAQPIHGA